MTCMFFKAFEFFIDAKTYPFLGSYANHLQSYCADQPFPVLFSFANILAHTNHSQKYKDWVLQQLWKLSVEATHVHI